MKKRVTVLENQNAFDLSIQAYGSIESVFDLMEDNSDKIADLTAPITAGVKLAVDRDPKDTEMVLYYSVNNYLPANGINSPAVLPPPILTGDYNNDYNNDYFNT